MADVFTCGRNCLWNPILTARKIVFLSGPRQVGKATLARAHAALRLNPSAVVTVDLPAQTVLLPDGSQAWFAIDGFSKRCLVEGLDELGALLADIPVIQQWEAACGR